MTKKAEVRKKVKKHVPAGVAHVTSTFNNTIIAITTIDGDLLSWSSSGKMGFKGSKKSTPYAAQMASENAAKAAMEQYGLQRITEVIVRGPGQGRESAIRALQAVGLVIVAIVDKTPVPHNGCRPPKRRRV